MTPAHCVRMSAGLRVRTAGLRKHQHSTAINSPYITYLILSEDFPQFLRSGTLISLHIVVLFLRHPLSRYDVIPPLRYSLYKSSPPHPTLVFICWSCKLYLSYLLFVALWCREPRTTSPPLEVTAMLVPLPPHPSRQWASSTLCPYMLEILYCLKMVCSITNILRAPNINSTSHLVSSLHSSLHSPLYFLPASNWF